MNYGFSNKEELYKRVGPALRAKKAELDRSNYPYIKEIDIWNYLIQEKWIKSKNLMLCDIVNDILKAENKDIDTYLKKKLESTERTHYFDKDLEIL